jgi:hypothetical protein
MSEFDASRIIIYYSRVMLQIVASLTDNSSGIIYDCNMFIVQTPVVNVLKLFFFVTDIKSNKLEKFVSGKPLKSSLIFMNKAGAY